MASSFIFMAVITFIFSWTTYCKMQTWGFAFHYQIHMHCPFCGSKVENLGHCCYIILEPHLKTMDPEERTLSWCASCILSTTMTSQMLWLSTNMMTIHQAHPIIWTTYNQCLFLCLFFIMFLSVEHDMTCSFPVKSALQSTWQDQA